MKKVFASAVAAALALSMAVPAFAAGEAGAINLTVDNANVEVGTQFNVAVSLSGVADMLNLEGVAGTGDLGAGDFSITYDPDVLEIATNVRGEPLFTVDSFITTNGLYSTSVTAVGDNMVSVQFFDPAAQGWGEDFTLGTFAFTVKEGVADGTETSITLNYASGGNSLVTAGASLAPEDAGVTIPNDQVALNGVTLTVGEEPEPSEPTESESTGTPTESESTGTPTESESTEAPTESESTETPTESESTTAGTDTTTTTGGTTTGGSGTGTGTGTGTTGGSSSNNKTGDAGVLAIGGLMVLAAGATMLTLKKKSK